MNNQSDIEQVVMRRVARIRVLRHFVSGPALALFVSVVALWSIGREVWVAHVFENAPTQLADIMRFSLFAFGHTRFVVQVLSVLVLMSLLYVARETAKLLSSLFVPVRS
ncbi:MAG: hypothetical protein Q7T37_01730 [bacterium]|nr:hypothetical protein [bacterium]MDO8742347.1 hypothetical protein [bacterium]